VDDGEDGVAAIHKRLSEADPDEVLAGVPAAGDAPDDSTVVALFLGSEDVHRHGESVLSPVDDVLGARGAGRLRFRRLRRDESHQRDMDQD
jgi:hypothetical protein